MQTDASDKVSSCVSAPDVLTDIAERVTSRLEGILTSEIERWGGLDLDLVPPLASLNRLVMSGGKRLRAAFCHWSFVGAGGDPLDSQALDAAAAFELLQVFALIHDDVMDNSATRRGIPTVHVEFAERHDQEDWRGEAENFGEGVAILVGDVAHVYADRLMTGMPVQAAEIWHELRIEVNIGQYLDLLGTVRGDTDLATAQRISRYKSGKYTIERPLHLGVALLGRLPELQDQLDRYGVPLGEAFQLRDDLLGVFGQPELTGKPIGEDLREGKPTPLLAIATAKATPGEREVLATVGKADLSEREIARIQQVLEDTGARDVVNASVDRLTTQAAASLADAPLEKVALDALADLATYVGCRDE